MTASRETLGTAQPRAAIDATPHSEDIHATNTFPIADLDPLAWKEPHMHSELDPATYGLTIWDLDREFLTDDLGGVDRLPLGKILGLLRDAYCRRVCIE